MVILFTGNKLNIIRKNTRSLLLCFFLCTNTLFQMKANIETIEQDNSTLEILLTDDAFEGYNLFVLERRNDQENEILNQTILITDLEGNIYLSREFPKTTSLDYLNIEFINSTTLLYGDFSDAKIWNIETNYTKSISMYGHHDYEKNYANDTYFAISKYVANIEGIDYLFDIVREYTEEGTVVWQLDTRNFTSHEYWCPYEDMVETWRDITHTNTVFYDEDEDMIYISCRSINTIYKIDHKTKEVVWSLGEYGNFRLFNRYGNEIDIMFYHQHALEKIDENSFLIFDNDEHNQTDNQNKQSRLLEFQIDTEKMFANVTWDWIAPETYYTGWYGDCDLLPNNNRLGTFGTSWHPGTRIGARLVEVDYDGKIVWKMDFDKISSESFVIYSMERFHFAPIVSEPRITDYGTNGSLVEWDIWYNFRSKTHFQGEYFITIDDELVETATIDFPKYWKPTTKSFHLDESYKDIQEISLVVADEGGHLSNESDLYSSTGKLSFKSYPSLALILGLSIGLPVITGIAVIIILEVTNKISIFKRKQV